MSPRPKPGNLILGGGKPAGSVRSLPPGEEMIVGRP